MRRRDLEESINAVRVSYGKSAADILKIGQNAAQGFGLSKSEFNGFAVQFQSFTKTIAGTDGNVAKTFDSLLGRARDFASVMNLDVGEAARLFQSGLAGETEPLRRFGIDLSAAAVQAFAYANGIAKAGKPLTEQQKVQARYALLMKKTAKTQGDFANTGDGLANMQRKLSASFKDLLASLGKSLLPVMTKLVTFLNDKGVPALNKFIGFLRDNPAIVKAFAIAIGVLAAGFLIAFIAANWIIVGIALLVAGLVYAYQTSETFRNIVNAVFTAVKTIVLLALAIIVAHIKVAIAVIKAVWATIKVIVGFVRSAFNFVKSIITAVVRFVASFVKARIAEIKAAWATIKAIVGSVRSAFNTAKSLISRS